jgi:hypothetical protein
LEIVGGVDHQVALGWLELIGLVLKNQRYAGQEGATLQSLDIPQHGYVALRHLTTHHEGPHRSVCEELTMSSLGTTSPDEAKLVPVAELIVRCTRQSCQLSDRNRIRHAGKLRVASRVSDEAPLILVEQTPYRASLNASELRRPTASRGHGSIRRKRQQLALSVGRDASRASPCCDPSTEASGERRVIVKAGTENAVQPMSKRVRAPS